MNAQSAGAPDYTIEIAPVTLDLSPHHRLTTAAYNGQVPGPLLRFKENKPVIVNVVNRTNRAEVVHWHGLFVPPDADGAMEEGAAPVAPNSSARYAFTPRPSGFRWYHTHTMAMNDLTQAQYGGQHGFLMIEPLHNPAPYDREFFLALHDWQAYPLAGDDGAMNPSYAVTTINGKAMRFGEPLRVKQGQRIMLHALNSSPTEVHWIALSGHSFRVVALDGNPVPNPKSVPMCAWRPLRGCARWSKRATSCCSAGDTIQGPGIHRRRPDRGQVAVSNPSSDQFLLFLGVLAQGIIQRQSHDHHQK